ncbi:MAG TPA: hypothetical protein VFB62_11540 [Polyangiaceae bacterium]|jgi:hypothetical protein|nr:hypothetical protein [Polyangiaceae bacterium]
MSRATLSLYELDRPALQQLSADLKRVLADDDRAAFATLLELGPDLAKRLDEVERLVDCFLLPDSDVRVAPLHASLRRISKKRALTKMMESSDAALEGRLRGFEPLRKDASTARLLDQLMNPQRLPWYLRRSGSTCGWIDGNGRTALTQAMRRMKSALPPELVELLDGLEQLDADAVLHDGL